MSVPEMIGPLEVQQKDTIWLRIQTIFLNIIVFTFLWPLYLYIHYLLPEEDKYSGNYISSRNPKIHTG